MSEARRNEIADLLRTSDQPITGSELARKFDISRQVIVQDIAVLRASGLNVLASSNGYFLAKQRKRGTIIKTIIATHEGIERMEEELLTIVEYGCKVLDVTIEHPIYGEIVAQLMLGSKKEVQAYMEKVKLHDAAPLSSLTEGHHIHTIEVPSEKVFAALEKDLEAKGFLL